MEGIGNPHDRHLRVAWRLCRHGLAEIAREPPRLRVLAWLDRAERLVPGSPYLREWRQIVSGQAPELARELRDVEDYFDLAPDRRGLWRPLVQSQPFSCLLPGRTTRERRTVLSRLP